MPRQRVRAQVPLPSQVGLHVNFGPTAAQSPFVRHGFEQIRSSVLHPSPGVLATSRHARPAPQSSSTEQVLPGPLSGLPQAEIAAIATTATVPARTSARMPRIRHLRDARRTSTLSRTEKSERRLPDFGNLAGQSSP